MKRTKGQKAITLIALIITIVVLLILAAVAISSITNDGILSYAQNAAKDYNQAAKNEQTILGGYLEYINGKVNSAEGEKTSIFPIEWNPVEETDVVISFNGSKLMKISDETPSEEEFENAYFMCSDILYSGQMLYPAQTLPFDVKQKMGNIIGYNNSSMTLAMCIIVYATGDVPEMGISFPETGIYVPSLNDGTNNINARFKIRQIMPKLETPSITLVNNVLTIANVENADSYEIYIDDKLSFTTKETTADISSKVNSLTDYFVSVRAISTNKYDPSDVDTVWCSSSKMAPGLYDDNDNLIVDLPSLIMNYGWAKNAPVFEGNYQTTATTLYYILNNNSELSTATKLIFDFETTITSGLFMGCSQLKNVILPNDLTVIGSDAFEGCANIQTINIPATVTKLFGSSFAGCNKLASITVESGNTVYHSAGNCVIKTAEKELVAGCKNSIIPNDGSVTVIGESSFEENAELTSIIIPADIVRIGNSAFEGCTSLKNIIYEENSGLTNIEGDVFRNCTSLEEIILPAKMLVMSGHAFEGCTSLKRVIFEQPKQWWYTNDGILEIQYAEGSVSETECATPETMANMLVNTRCYRWFSQYNG